MEEIKLKKIVDQLTVEVFDTRAEMGKAAAAEAAAAIRAVLAEKDECNIIFAAAPSQNEVLAGLREADVDWSRVNAFHMDEYIGLPVAAPQHFSNFLKTALFEHLPFKNVFYINGSAAVIEDEVERYAALLVEYPTDLCCLGIGENGHIAFNDPPEARFDDPELIRIVALDERSRVQQVNDKCFDHLDEVPKTAMTLTIPALSRARQMIAVVPGKTKAEAVKRCLTGEVSEDCPATILRRHGRASLYLDTDSAEIYLAE